jgi:hypothetical protein
MIFEGADASGFEEDARLTAMWLWTLSAATAAGSDGEETLVEDEESSSVRAKGGFTLEFDAARKIAQGLGAHVDRLTHLVATKGDQARLLPVAERTAHLFGKDAVGKATVKPRRAHKQLEMFEELRGAEQEQNAWGDVGVPPPGATTLDRVHQSMILFGAGRGEALKRFLVEEGIGQDERFWRLAQALSALYPAGTDEKRWVDGLLARKKGLGF